MHVLRSQTKVRYSMSKCVCQQILANRVVVVMVVVVVVVVVAVVVAGSVKYAQGGCNTRAKLCELIAAKTGGQ